MRSRVFAFVVPTGLHTGMVGVPDLRDLAIPAVFAPAVTSHLGSERGDVETDDGRVEGLDGGDVSD